MFKKKQFNFLGSPDLTQILKIPLRSPQDPPRFPQDPLEELLKMFTKPAILTIPFKILYY
jgi:hypothetical protein